MSIQVQIRRGTNAQRLTMNGVGSNPAIPAVGELIYTIDTNELYIGDGVTVGGKSLKLSNIEEISSQTILGNNTTGSSDVLELTPAQVRTIINVADGATANDSDADLKNRLNHTGQQLASTIFNFNNEVASTPAVQANTAKVTNATHTGEVFGSTILTIANGVVDSNNLSTTLDFGSLT